MKRENIVFIVGLISILIGSIISVSAVTYLYNSSEVSYDNTNSGISSTNVQNAITELYDAAQDYSSMNTRVSALEGHWTGGANSYFYLRGLSVTSASTDSDKQSYINMFHNDVNRGSIVGHSGGLSISARNSSGTWGTGTLGLLGDTINIGNGSNTATVNLNGAVRVNNIFTFARPVDPSNVNTLSINVPYSSYRYLNGLMFTRYGCYYIYIYYSNGSSTMVANAVKLGDIGNAETITVTASNGTAVFKSNKVWNSFSIYMTASDSVSDLTYTTSSTS